MSNTADAILTPALQAIVDVVKAKLGEAEWTKRAGVFLPLIQDFGPALLAMGEAGIMDWLKRSLAGDEYTAYRDLVKNLPTGNDILGKWNELDAKWSAANTVNFNGMQWKAEIVSGILMGVIQIAKIMVCL